MEKTSSSSSSSKSLPLNLCHVMKKEMIINRAYMLFLGIALTAWFYYRTTNLIPQIFKPKQYQSHHLLPQLLVFLSELLFVFLWVLHQVNRWRPVKRTVFPDRLTREDNDKFPRVDVFVCTTDPGREPSLGVMNTVISAMSLDYPPDKLSIYLSDDGGSFVTLRAMKEAWRFSKWWVPFIRKYDQVKIGCPEAYFSGGAEESDDDDEFIAEKMEIKKRYDEFKKRLEMNSVNASDSVSRDHKPTIEVISDENDNGENSNNEEDYNNMPLLVYVAREKRASHPHNFKAGALNTLIRVSAVMSNAPYILVLDCDHYCNDPSSARQAMCFYLDPQISSKLAFVLFPQKFHNMSDHDIYDCRLNYYWRRILGLDGIQGPYISGCNMYLKREALYGNGNIKNDLNLNEMKKSLGSSNELIKSAHPNYKSHNNRVITDALQKEVQLLATCTYDSQSQWGTQVGFIYFSVVEDISTSLYLHRQGWISVFIDPPRPCFLGSSPTNLSELFFQHSRWGLGLMQISLSKYCSLLHIGRAKISTLQCMGYAALTFDSIYVVPFLIVAIIPQICLLHRIPLYPKVSDPCFVLFAFIFLVSQLKHVQEVVFYGDSIRTTLYELRVWIMKSASCYLYATLDAFLYTFGLQNANFNLTSKVVDDERETRFKKGIYDFQGSPMLIAPICSLYILNLASFSLGVAKMILNHEANELFVQAFIPFFGIVVNYQVFEGMVLRVDKGRIPPCVTIVSLAIATFILCFGSLVLI